jgi:hypothetical protein
MRLEPKLRADSFSVLSLPPKRSRIEAIGDNPGMTEASGGGRMNRNHSREPTHKLLRHPDSSGAPAVFGNKAVLGVDMGGPSQPSCCSAPEQRPLPVGVQYGARTQRCYGTTQPCDGPRGQPNSSLADGNRDPTPLQATHRLWGSVVTREREPGPSVHSRRTQGSQALLHRTDRPREFTRPGQSMQNRRRERHRPTV